MLELLLHAELSVLECRWPCRHGWASVDARCKKKLWLTCDIPIEGIAMEHFPVTIQGHPFAYGLVTTKVPDTGVIFVHGFDGNPKTTWVNFEGMVEGTNHRSMWNKCDLFFYAYESRDQIPVLARAFLTFLKRIATYKGRDIIDPSNYSVRSIGKFKLGVPINFLTFRGGDPYKNMILVGHSTGAVIIREALCKAVRDIIKDQKDLQEWLKRKTPNNADRLIVDSRLRFFAPAHRGVIAAGNLGIARNVPIIEKALALRLASSPLYQNLSQEGAFILDLRAETEKLYEQYKFEALRARSLFGEHEEIVNAKGYSHDEETEFEPGHYHSSVCKPGMQYSKPLTFVMDASSSAKNA